MGQESTLVDFGKRIYNKLQPEQRAGSRKKVDPAWHAKMVDDANDSFRKRKVGGSAKKANSTKRMVAKKTGASSKIMTKR